MKTTAGLIKKILIYVALILGSLHLYFPHNQDKEHAPSSNIQFVYAQF